MFVHDGCVQVSLSRVSTFRRQVFSRMKSSSLCVRRVVDVVYFSECAMSFLEPGRLSVVFFSSNKGNDTNPGLLLCAYSGEKSSEPGRL